MPLGQNVKLQPKIKLDYYMKNPHLCQVSIIILGITSINHPSMV